MSLMLQEPLTHTKKELKKEFSSQGLARASDAHKKGHKGTYYPTKTVGYLKR